MKRKIIGNLLKLKEQTGSMKPILLCGAKHVGKTYALKEFASLCYKNIFYLNFEEQREAALIFEEKKGAKELILEMESLLKQKIEKNETLIIFDDLHFCRKALFALTVLGNAEYDVSATIEGNRLTLEEIKEAVNEGAIYAENVFPMDFEEFLWAKGKEVLAYTIGRHFDEMRPMPVPLHEECKEEFENYLLAGGMPTAVCAHLYHKNPEKEEEYKELIWDSYISDMAGKLSGVSAMKAKEVFNSLPFQLEKENKKFQYKFVKEGGRAAFYSGIIDFIEDLGLVLKSTKKDTENIFKLYLNDTGLLASKFKINRDYLRRRNNGRMARALYENGVALQLVRSGYKLRYWVSNGIAEIDFILETKDGNIPVEINHEDSSKAKSLKVYEEKFNPPYMVKFSNGNFATVENCKNIPFYAGFKI